MTLFIELRRIIEGMQFRDMIAVIRLSFDDNQ